MPKTFQALEIKLFQGIHPFFQKPLLSPSREVRLLAHIVSRDPESVTEGERWRLGLLESLLKIRRTKSTCLEDNQKITAILNSLCNS